MPTPVRSSRSIGRSGVDVFGTAMTRISCHPVHVADRISSSFNQPNAADGAGKIKRLLTDSCAPSPPTDAAYSPDRLKIGIRLNRVAADRHRFQRLHSKFRQRAAFALVIQRQLQIIDIEPRETLTVD